MKQLVIIFCFSWLLLACTGGSSEHKKELPSLPTDGIAEYYNLDKWPFYHGVASGDPLYDRVIIWTRVTPKDSLESIPVNWEVAADQDFNQVLQSGKTTATPERDYTVKVDVEQLQPGKEYFYRFNALGEYSPIGTTKTANDNPDQLLFGVVSCSNYEFGTFFAYGALAEEEDIDAVIHLGDYIYEYGPGRYGDSTLNREHYPRKEIITLQDYRLRYSQYRLDTNLSAVHAAHPFITVWDDHEIANNSYKEGAQNHQTGEGDYLERKRAAKKAYYEWMPVRESENLYRTFNYGGLAKLIMLDERLAGRTSIADSLNDPTLRSPERSMLGDQQLNWFKKELSTSEAKWQVIGNQVIFSYLNWGHETFNINLDSWDGYPVEREKIKSHIISNTMENVIFITGDTHSAFAFEVTDQPFSEYNQLTAEGAFAIEFGTTSINSGNSDEMYPTDSVIEHEKKITNSPINPHLKYANLRDHGYMLLSLSPERAKATWRFVDRITPDSPVKSHSLEVKSGEPKLVE